MVKTSSHIGSEPMQILKRTHCKQLMLKSVAPCRYVKKASFLYITMQWQETLKLLFRCPFLSPDSRYRIDAWACQPVSPKNQPDIWLLASYSAGPPRRQDGKPLFTGLRDPMIHTCGISARARGKERRGVGRGVVVVIVVYFTEATLL